MESVGEQDTLAQHPLVPSGKLDLGNSESMSEMETSVHVWVWKVSEPLGVLFLELFLGKASKLLRLGSVDLEDLFFLPSILVFLLERLEEISLGRLGGCSAGGRVRGGGNTWASSMVWAMEEKGAEKRGLERRKLARHQSPAIVTIGI